MAFLISAFVGLSQLMGSSVSVGGMSGGVSGAGQFSSSLNCSAHRFSCSSVVVGGSPSSSWLVCLLEFARQLLDYQVQVFEAPLSGCFLCLTGLVFDVIPFILTNAPLHFSVRCSIFYLRLCLGCSCSACVQVSFPLFPLASGWCQQRSIPCVRSPSCPELLHTYCARVSCCPPTVSRCLSPYLLSAPVVAGICWKG